MLIIPPITNSFTRLKRVVLLISLSFSLTAGYAQSAEEGEKLFNENCTSCHAINDKVVGPALKDVHKHREEAWLVKWIHNSQALVKSGDPIAVQLFKENNNMVMNSFESMSEAQIKSIIAYIGKASETPAAPAATASAPAGGGEVVAAHPATNPADGFYNNTTLFILVGIALILAIIIILLYRVRSTLLRMLAEKYPDEYGYITEEQAKKSPLFNVKKWNPTVATVSIVAFLLLVWGTYGFIYGNKEVGVQQGYAPTQPIAFPHDTHAGTYKINCMFCHSTADKSKQASIPSLNTCMNCHMHVQAKDKYNGQISPEIQKIYTAIGWDPEKRVYDETKPRAPIKWVRIHNLPDHVYFNHSQHVKVGKVECQTCHGPVETMKVVQQHATLQMGWCINCHRERKIDVEGNKYYEKLHQQLKAENKQFITVAQNGGLECAKCHY